MVTLLRRSCETLSGWVIYVADEKGFVNFFFPVLFREGQVIALLVDVL